MALPGWGGEGSDPQQIPGLQLTSRPKPLMYQSIKTCIIVSYPKMRSHVYKMLLCREIHYDEESDHSNKAVRKTPEIESGHKVSEEVK